MTLMGCLVGEGPRDRVELSLFKTERVSSKVQHPMVKVELQYKFSLVIKKRCESDIDGDVTGRGGMMRYIMNEWPGES